MALLQQFCRRVSLTLLDQSMPFQCEAWMLDAASRRFIFVPCRRVRDSPGRSCDVLFILCVPIGAPTLSILFHWCGPFKTRPDAASTIPRPGLTVSGKGLRTGKQESRGGGLPGSRASTTAPLFCRLILPGNFGPSCTAKAKDLLLNAGHADAESLALCASRHLAGYQCLDELFTVHDSVPFVLQVGLLITLTINPASVSPERGHGLGRF